MRHNEAQGKRFANSVRSVVYYAVSTVSRTAVRRA